MASVSHPSHQWGIWRLRASGGSQLSSVRHQGTQETLHACSGRSPLDTREAAEDSQGLGYSWVSMLDKKTKLPFSVVPALRNTHCARMETKTWRCQMDPAKSHCDQSGLIGNPEILTPESTFLPVSFRAWPVDHLISRCSESEMAGNHKTDLTPGGHRMGTGQT